MLNQYKWILILGCFLVYSFGIWHVASKYKESVFLKEKLDMAIEIQEAIEKFNTLNDSISSKVQEELSKIKQKNVAINKEIHNETAKDPVYNSCKSTDGVVQQYRDKLSNQ